MDTPVPNSPTTFNLRVCSARRLLQRSFDFGPEVLGGEVPVFVHTAQTKIYLVFKTDQSPWKALLLLANFRE